MYNQVNAGSYLFNKTDTLKNVQDFYLHKCKSITFEQKKGRLYSRFVYAMTWVVSRV